MVRIATYGLRAHAFRELLSLPERTGHAFRIALDIHPAERADLARLEESGWTLEDPLIVAGDPDAYRDFVAGSHSELMVAKALYTDTRSGWLSDRSACYLASGRPVLASDTGFEAAVPAGDGLLSFETLEEAVAAAELVGSTAKRVHDRAARELAEAYFDSARVLPRLLDSAAARGTADRAPARIV